MAAFRATFLVCEFLALIALASAADAARLRLDWVDNSDNEKGFRIWRRAEAEGTYAEIAARESNASSYVDTTVTDGTTYCYLVTAYNDTGDSAPSNEACATASATSGSSPTPSAPASAGDGGGGGGCFIATAAFGSPLAPQVQHLRKFRDRVLLPNGPGRVVLHGYYAVSPPIADLIRQSETLRAVVRFALWPLVGWVTLALWSPVMGWGVPFLPVVAVIWLVGRRFRQR